MHAAFNALSLAMAIVAVRLTGQHRLVSRPGARRECGDREAPGENPRDSPAAVVNLDRRDQRTVTSVGASWKRAQRGCWRLSAAALPAQA